MGSKAIIALCPSNGISSSRSIPSVLSAKKAVWPADFSISARDSPIILPISVVTKVANFSASRRKIIATRCIIAARCAKDVFFQAVKAV
jgi:hypothetical protein